MSLLSKFNDSCALTSGMADRLGCDIPGAISRDPETQAAAYRSAVLRCMRCKEQADCRRLQDSTDHLDSAPSYCQNDWS